MFYAYCFRILQIQYERVLLCERIKYRTKDICRFDPRERLSKRWYCYLFVRYMTKKKDIIKITLVLGNQLNYFN